MPKPQTRRQFLRTAAGVALGAAMVGPLVRRARAAAAGRPNIVLIMADDMGFSDIGCYGGEIATPNLDRLAAGGLRFTQFYNTARCCPTRASLLTGLYPHQAGVGHMVGNKGIPPYQGYLNQECVTIAEALGPAGYHTLMSGKWHVGEDRPHWPCDRGFDRYYGLISGGSNYWRLDPGRKFARDNEPAAPEGGEFYMTDAFTSEAIAMLDEVGRDSRPFFLYVAYTAPHWPLHAHPEDIAKYQGRYLGGWDALRKERHARMIRMGLVDKKWPLTPRDGRAPPWESVQDKAMRDLKMAVYAAQIGRMDAGIGRILEKVRDFGKEENTLVLFLADNGGLVAYWPKVIKKGGAITHEVGHLIDIMATCCDVAGADYPTTHKGRPVTPCEGKSLLPVFQTGRRQGHEAIYWEHEGNRAVRMGKWKLVSRHPGTWELYDMEADRTELQDLAARQPDVVRKMAAVYDAWARRSGVVPWDTFTRKTKKKA